MTKYPCAKEAARQQAALDALKAEMLASMADMIEANNGKMEATASALTGVKEEGVDDVTCQACDICTECE